MTTEARTQLATRFGGKAAGTGDRAFHDDYRRGDEVKGSSDRSFGVVFAVVFAVVGAWPLSGGGAPRAWALLLAAAFLAAALFRPVLLGPLNRLWLRLGLLLHKIVNPLLMGLIFFTTVAPMGMVLRLMGRDLLGLRLAKEAKSYWVQRDPPGPPPESMRHQF